MFPESKIAILKDRAYMLQKARSFFYERDVYEVDCPSLSQFASVDAHIDLISAKFNKTVDCFLHSSPEYGMKRLLAEGAPDIYQLSHVFRDGEYGKRHNPEFMMAEWYRRGMSFEGLIEETLDFVKLFVGELPFEVLSYQQAFIQHAGIDPFLDSDSQLQDCLKKNLPDVESTLRDDILNYILGVQVEPKLGDGKLTALAYYPPSQAALAKTCLLDNELVAMRFEIYYQGVELANGYHELQDPDEQLRRLHEANALRLELGKEAYPIDMRFIDALRLGLPQCSGVACGFDRLMMLRHKKQALAEVMPFTWQSS